MNAFLVWTGSGPVMSLRNQFVAFSSIEVKLMRWYHHCFAFDYDTGKYTMILDGEVIDEGTHTQKLTQLKGGHFINFERFMWLFIQFAFL